MAIVKIAITCKGETEFETYYFPDWNSAQKYASDIMDSLNKVPNIDYKVTVIG